MEVRNIALLGHKDHGKSTLIGSLLMQTGAATKVRVMEAEAYSKKLHRPFEPAFILDSFSEERARGMTYDTTRAEIKYRSAALALIDVPGHEELKGLNNRHLPHVLQRYKCLCYPICICST